MLLVDSMIRKQWYRSIRSVSQHPLARMHYAWTTQRGMAWKGCSLRAMDYLYEREINSNKGSLKTRRKQSARKEKREREKERTVREDAKEKNETSWGEKKKKRRRIGANDERRKRERERKAGREKYQGKERETWRNNGKRMRDWGQRDPNITIFCDEKKKIPLRKHSL